MESSSDDSDWEESDTSRELNARVVSSGRLPLRLIHNNQPGVSRDASSSNSKGFVEKMEENQVLPCTYKLDTRVGSSEGFVEKMARGIVDCGEERGDTNLRQWLDKPERSIDPFECLYIFRQIVEIVNLAHSQGIVVHNVRPSCFVMSAFNHVSFIESASSSSPSSDSCEDGLDSRHAEAECPLPYPKEVDTQSKSQHVHPQLLTSPVNASQRKLETDCLISSSTYLFHRTAIEDDDERNTEYSRDVSKTEGSKMKFPLKHILLSEISWYTSPEEIAGAPTSFSSDIYRLGVLLFELFCTFSSTEEKLTTMSNLRHRVLPPQLLLYWPKDASFCLWLLHPLPSMRPKMIEVLKSEFLNESRVSFKEREAATKLREEIEGHDLLLEFLTEAQQRKQDAADKVHDHICCLSFDINEILKQKPMINSIGGPFSGPRKDDCSSLENVDFPLQNPVAEEDLPSSRSRKRVRPGQYVTDKAKCYKYSDDSQKSESEIENQGSIMSKRTQLIKNFKILECAYFSTRCGMVNETKQTLTRCSPISSSGRGSIVKTEGSSIHNLDISEGYSGGKKFGWTNPFLEGLSKYLSYSSLKVKAELKQGDLLNSSNLVSSLGFDRDKEFFASTGVNRKIKVFEYNMIRNEDRDIQYPVIEMASRSKLSSICWNSYIKSQIASSDFEGAVQVWDVTRGQVFMEMREHERRAWSIDFSSSDPTKLASGSDDGSVKLWNINQERSLSTIRLKANVCCVQFPPDSAHSLVFGSADHNIYCYDLRNTKIPWSTLIGHTKTVSYLKFIDPSTLVSASTDNSLKLWDLSTCTSRILDKPVHTFAGHTNMKNFVGLSICDGYIATGSETNEVFVYHKAFPMPVLSFKFGNEYSLSGDEVDDTTQFISSVCWRDQSTLVAANSAGNIKLLEMV